MGWMDDSAAGYIANGGRAATDWEAGLMGPYGSFAVFGSGTAAPVSIPPAAVATSTGVNPTETAYSLYGHIIPLSIGRVRIGGEIISGPWVENGKASFIISFGVPFDPSDTRTLKEIAFDSEVVWTAADGFSTEPFTYRFYSGTLSQAADALETAHFGADAVAYRPQMLIAFENLPLSATKFGKIPYVAALIEDSTGGDVNFGSAFETLAYSPWVGWTSSQFETSGVTDGVTNGGMIIAQQAQFLQTIQQFGRFYRNWDILQTDKLRIVDRGANLTPDLTLDKTRLMEKVSFLRSEPNSVPRELELTTIDPDADYTLVPSKASRPRDPVNVTESVATDTAYLPVVMDSPTRISLATYAKYQEEVARKRVSAKAMIYGLELEPGAIVAIDAGEDFRTEAFKVVETLHGVNYVVEFTAEAMLHCEVDLTDPDFGNVVLLMGFEGSDGSSGAPGFTDESPAAHGVADDGGGFPVISTAQRKFGSSSYRTIDGVQFPISSDWLLSSANSDQFTVECWVRLNSLTTDMIVGKFSATTLVTWDFGLFQSEFRFRASSNGTTNNINVTSSGASLTTDAWYHLAVDKDASGKIRIYKDGVMMASDTPADSSFHEFGGALAIAENPFDGAPPTGGIGMDGWLDELRITKGVARYASDGGFAVPSSAFPRTGS